MYRATVVRHVFYDSSDCHKTVLTTVNVSRDSRETCFLLFLCQSQDCPNDSQFIARQSWDMFSIIPLSVLDCPNDSQCIAWQSWDMFSVIPLTVTRLSYRQSMCRAKVVRHVFYYSSVSHKTVLTTVNLSHDSRETCFLLLLWLSQDCPTDNQCIARQSWDMFSIIPLSVTRLS